MKDKLLKALRTKYEAQAAEAEATLEVYFDNPAGIGEHPQIVEEMSKQFESLETAVSCLELLDKRTEELPSQCAWHF